MLLLLLPRQILPLLQAGTQVQLLLLLLLLPWLLPPPKAVAADPIHRRQRGIEWVMHGQPTQCSAVQQLYGEDAEGNCVICAMQLTPSMDAREASSGSCMANLRSAEVKGLMTLPTHTLRRKLSEK